MKQQLKHLKIHDFYKEKVFNALHNDERRKQQIKQEDG